VVSQPRITPEGKAQADSKAQQPLQYESISRGLQRRHREADGGYETTSIHKSVQATGHPSCYFASGKFDRRIWRVVHPLRRWRKEPATANGTIEWKTDAPCESSKVPPSPSKTIERGTTTPRPYSNAARAECTLKRIMRLGLARHSRYFLMAEALVPVLALVRL